MHHVKEHAEYANGLHIVHIQHILYTAHVRHVQIIPPPDVVRGRHARQYHSCPAQVAASPMINTQIRGICTEIVRSYDPADTSKL